MSSYYKVTLSHFYHIDGNLIGYIHLTISSSAKFSRYNTCPPYKTEIGLNTLTSSSTKRIASENVNT